jgi:hypothetical protein
MARRPNGVKYFWKYILYIFKRFKKISWVPNKRLYPFIRHLRLIAKKPKQDESKNDPSKNIQSIVEECTLESKLNLLRPKWVELMAEWALHFIFSMKRFFNSMQYDTFILEVPLIYVPLIL